jgi:hypothetical protein
MQMLDGETWAAARDDVMRSVGAMVRAGDFEQATATIGELMLFCRSRRFHPVLNEDLSASNKEAQPGSSLPSSGLERNGARPGAALVTLQRGVEDHYVWKACFRPLPDGSFSETDTSLGALNDMCEGLTRWPHEASSARIEMLELQGLDSFKRATNGLNPINQSDDLIAQDLARLKVASDFHALMKHAADACGNGPALLVVQDHDSDWLPVAIRQVAHDPEQAQPSTGLFGRLFKRAS